MLSKEDYIALTMNPSLLPKILLILDIEGLVTVRDRINPSLENSTLNGYLVHSETTEEQEVESWIDDWRNMFTEKLGPYRLCIGIGNRQTCITRMLLFLNKVSSDIELIFEATELYLNDCIENNRLSKLPQYFILPQTNGKLEKANLKEGDLYEWFGKALKGESNKDISVHDA